MTQQFKETWSTCSGALSEEASQANVWGLQWPLILPRFALRATNPLKPRVRCTSQGSIFTHRSKASMGFFAWSPFESKVATEHVGLYSPQLTCDRTELAGGRELPKTRLWTNEGMKIHSNGKACQKCPKQMYSQTSITYAPVTYIVRSFNFLEKAYR